MPAALEKQDKHSLVTKLEKVHLLPLVTQTVEHLLCEYRKLVDREKSGELGTEETQSPDEEFRRLFAEAWPVYLNNDLLY